ncbi:putative defense protein 3 [Eleutherodactylus coqui]|uniref:putative defense protein 3 n=1 Tax=Eleutherodactylus coqui TaxID=57060 RepID=UPI003462A68D
MTQLILSLLLVMITCNTISVSYPSGAPISACQTMKPQHDGVYPKPKPAPYMMKINSSSYRNGGAIQVQILGPPYKGILLQARTYSKTTPYGTWLEPPINTKILPCPENPLGSITHSNTNLKGKSTTYIWIAPNTSCPDVLFFIATVVQSFDVYWLGVRSAIIYNDQKATCSITETPGQTDLLSASSRMAWQPALHSFICLQLVLFFVQRHFLL